MKRLDRFMLQNFLPLFAMTFFICTFIVLMQFLWMHINDMVGKGLGASVLLEMLFYASLSMVPMALPLAVLLASLMTFGNLGESLELTALKSGGISLWRVMRPLIVLMVMVAVGAFFFQNDVLPVAQSRMWTLLKSMRQKSPELDIEEGVFNDQIANYNIYVEKKNRNTGVLYNVMIYDFSQGFERSRVIMADSATLATAPDRMNMVLTIFSGELFENMRQGVGSAQAAKSNNLYRREEFKTKEIRMPFDANFERMDAGEMSSLYIGKDMGQLLHSIDSIHRRTDSISTVYAREVTAEQPLGNAVAATDVAASPLDSMLVVGDFATRRRQLEAARNQAQARRNDYFGRSLYIDDEHKQLALHGIELHRKFTLSLACLVFFFIGAPLGAIIRKGGLGTPLVISVFLFIFYFILDNMGMKMAKAGKVPVWEGMWLSSGVLLPLGVWVTYKAVRDSSMFNAEAWQRTLRMLTGRHRRALTVKEVVIEDLDPQAAAAALGELSGRCGAFICRYPRARGYRAYWRGGIRSADVRSLTACLEHTVALLSNSRSPQLIAALNRLPVVQNLRILHPSGRLAVAAMWCLPVGLPIWLLALLFERRVIGSVKTVNSMIDNLQTQLSDIYETQHH